MKTPRFASRSSAGFTLVELTVSMTVLALMMLSMAQVMTGALKATTGSFKHMDADTQARLVLDRMAFDISKMVKRTDVDYYFAKGTATSTTPGNDQMAFFSEAGGYYPSASTAAQKSNVSLVGYRVNASNQLERLSKGLVWNGVGGSNSLVYLPQTILGTWPAITGAGASADSDYQVIGDQVFRLEFSYLVRNTNGTTAATVSDTPNLESISSGVGYFNPQEVVAIIVTMAVLDSSSAASVTSTQRTTAAVKLTDAPSTGTSSATWRSSLTSLGLPPAAASQVRIYQRYCYLSSIQ